MPSNIDTDFGPPRAKGSMTSDRDQGDSASGSASTSNSGLGESVPSRKYMVRAQFDFEASDPSALSFKAGDIIEVYTMLESGWWDGMLDQRRGWFPSNFVEEIREDEEEGGWEDGASLSQGEYSHGHGLVGDQMGERDLAMLERDDFGVPLHHHSRTRSNEFGGSFDDLMRGAGGWGNAGGLDALAREMVDANLDDEEEDEGAAFEAEAMRRRGARRSDATAEFGNIITPHTARTREATDNTIRQRPLTAAAGQDSTPVKQVDMQDAWIPSLTPDGQVGQTCSSTGAVS
jgi:son of sevenless-like protein